MCGITGLFSFEDSDQNNFSSIEKATDTLSKRGPDSRGTIYFRKGALGHRRLSIIDTTEGAAQPMQSADGRYTLVFNGEIYNFKSLRKALEDDGVVFQTASDTEVLLHLYIKKGKNALDQLNGFFVFAIYDRQEDHLFIARDRMGIKPLLYFKDDRQIGFASEMKALMALGIEKKLNYNALLYYLQFNYIPAPLSILENVHKLLPGHYIEITKGTFKTGQYYQIPYTKEKAKESRLSYDKQKEKLVHLLDQSVQKRMVADVPLGAFLSGGIDSSVITALASRHTEKLNTFSIGYKDEPYFDETHYAKLVADRFRTNHTVFSLSNNDLYEHLHDILEYIDEPFADSSALAVYILNKETRKKVTVALSGDGADELFSGYNKHMAAFRAMNGGLAAQAVRILLPVWKALPKSRNSAFSNKVRQFQRFAIGMQLDESERYWRWASFIPEHQAATLLKDPGENITENEEYRQVKAHYLRHFEGETDMNDILYADMQLVLPNDMLTKVDLMSMANSVEVRVPFLDHELVEFGFSLPSSSKINSQMKKRIVQDAFRDILPAELYNRPKHGFEVPLLKWFRGELRGMIENDLLSDAFIEQQGIFQLDAIRKLKQKLFSTDPGDTHAQIWGLIVFQSWWKKHMSDN